MKRLWVIVVSCLFLCSCSSRITKYTSEDASQYNLVHTKTTKAKMVDVKTVNQDTIWTFEESYDRGLRWQIIDHHYYTSFSMYKTNTLTTNYTVVVLDYYLDLYPSIKDTFKVSYTYIDGYKSSILFTCEFADRKTLENNYTLLKEFLDTVTRENAQYADKSIDYQLQAQFIHNRQTISVSDFTDFSDVDTQNLQYNIVYDEQDGLSQYTQDEINAWKQTHQETLIYVRNDTDAQWQPTQYYTNDLSFSIASTVFYDYLQQLQVDNIEIIGDRNSYTVRANNRTYGIYQNSMISFYEAQRISSVQFNIEKNVVKQNHHATN